MALDAVTGASRVLVVASEDAAAAWRGRLVADGVEAVAVPWSTIAPGPDVLRAAQALRAAAEARGEPRPLGIVTSRNALRFLPEGSGRHVSAVVVGAFTRDAAEDAGFDVERGPAADAGPAAESATGFAFVARRLLERSPPRAALWLRGGVVAREGVDLLAAAGWRIEEFVTYVAVARPEFAAEVRAALPARAFVVGSPAAARALAAALGEEAFPPPRGGARLLVPGDTTAAALAVGGRVVPEVVPGLPEGLAARLARA